MKPTPKILSIFLIVLTISVLFSSCKKDEKGTAATFTVDNLMAPVSAISYDTIYWDIDVTSLGSALIIDSIRAKFVCISGWANGQTILNQKLPVTNIAVTASQTKTVFSSPVIVINTGTTNVDVRNTATCYSNGQAVSDDVIYTIIKGTKKAGSINGQTIKSELIKN
jgi:hypothetical protein